MKRHFKHIIFILTLLIISSTSFSQVYSFSKDPKQFQKDVKTFFKKYKIEETQEIVGNFLYLVDNDLFEPEEYLEIVSTCNLMLKTHHLRPSPHFAEYFEIIVAYKKNNIDIEKFKQWDKVYVNVLSESKRKVRFFNKTVLTLFTKNALYSTASKTWYIYSDNYSFSYNKQPIITIDSQITLTCRTKEDTIQLFNTMGEYYPFEFKWEGHEGRMDWRRVYEDTNEVFAFVHDYTVNVKKAELIADSAVFRNNRYFSLPLVGRLHDKGSVINQGKKSLYPKFRSYKAVYILDKLSKNILYIGGFTQKGLQIMGTSSMDEYGPKQYARVYISYKGQKTLKAVSDEFLITPEKIVSKESRTTIYYENDSFYHPKIIFNYVINDRKLLLTRGDEGMYRSPMYDTYHKLEMEFDQMEWKIDDARIDFRLFYGSEGSAYFTSEKFFTQNKYIRTQSVLTYHPLNRIKAFSEQLDTNIFHINDFAAYMGVRPKYLLSLLIRLTMNGFIIYDDKSGDILVREKTFHFENASKNKVDYDFLRLESVIKKSNAIFNLNTGLLDLQGVGFVLLSDTHKVHIIPKEQSIKMKTNRNFEFGGYIRAGLFEFFGDNFYFDYDNFKIDLKKIDSVRMYVRFDPSKPTLVAMVKSVLQDVSGYLYIDHPENKSGRKNYAEYPIFECTEHSYVYYDKKEILGGAYDKERFYFDIKPFTVDSLYHFSMKGLEFAGTFYSGNILPVFDYKLTPQEDFSLGFTKVDNFQLYVGKGEQQGIGDMSINLSNKGLRGNGTIDYLTSITESNDFIFYFDSTIANSQSFNITHNARGIYPKVQGTDVFTRWFPYQDTMIIEKLLNPFLIFEKELEFSGDLVLTPQQLSSSGIFNYKTSTIKSNDFVFQPTTLHSGSAILKLESDVPGTSAFVAPDVTLDLDVISETTKGIANSGKNRLHFPVNKYMTSMKKFTWYSNEQRVDITKDESQRDDKSYFMSIKHGQDSLLFQSTVASYNLKNFNIYAEKIPYIPVADAYIYPNENKAVIEKDAHIQSLANALIKADTINFYHEIHHAFINIFGKYKYTGYGQYDYIDKYKNKQEIRFYQIRVDNDKRTYARGSIPDSAVFFLHPRFRFSGYAELNGNINELNFDGYVKPKHEITKVNTFWFSFNDRVNPDTMFLAVNNPKGKDGRDLFTGVYQGTDSPYVYNVFMGRKKKYTHPEIFGIHQGILYYDDNLSRYVYSNKDKLFDNDLRGQYFTFDEENGHMSGEGKIDFGENVKKIDIKTAGHISFNGETGKYLFNISMLIDFPFDKKALDQMSDILIENSYFKKDTRENNETTLKSIAELIDDEKERQKMIEEIQSFNIYRTTKDFSSTLIFTDLKLTYNVKTRSFQSDITELGLSSIKRVDIHKGLDGAIELSQRRSGFKFTLYFESDQYNYYFFNYNYGIFGVLSSDPVFNEMVINTASKNSAPKYRIKIGSNRSLTRFKRTFKLE